MFDRARGLFVAIITLFALSILIHPLVASAGNVALLDPDTPIRFLGALIVTALALVAVYAADDALAWRLDAQAGVYAVIGAIVSGVVRWLFTGDAFVLPAFEQVTLQPALLPPILFGVAYGPVVGFVAGAGGSLLANLFAGWALPQVDFAYGLAGLVAGLSVVWTEDGRRHLIVSTIAGVLGAAAVALFFVFPQATVGAPPGSPLQPPTMLLGFAPLLGAGLAIATRYAFPTRPRWGEVSLWGVLGVFVALLARALLLMLTDGLSLESALVGEFLANAGANALAVAVLVPPLLALREWYAALPDTAEDAA